MLVPAVCYKEDLEKKFAKEIYSDRYFYYVGYVYGFELPNIGAYDNNYQWAILDSKNELVGYLAYSVDVLTNNVDKFGLYSFDEGNPLVISDTYKVLEELCKKYHRIEWRVVDGNHAKKGYDTFCKKHGGNILCLHDVTKGPDNTYRDIYIYEIVNN